MKNSIASRVGAVVRAASSMLKRADAKNDTGTALFNDTTVRHGRQPFNAFWLYLKGAVGRRYPGMTHLPQWRWPDKDQYGQAEDGSVRRRTPKVPFRVRRWRKRAAARVSKRDGHTLDYARQIVNNIEKGIIRDIVDARNQKKA